MVGMTRPAQVAGPQNADTSRRRLRGYQAALERAGIRGLREGQKVSFETETDRRSGKLAVSTIQEA